MDKRNPPAKGKASFGVKTQQSLIGYLCPSPCHGTFKLLEDGTNVCQTCGRELVTEYEWERRQKSLKAMTDPPCDGCTGVCCKSPVHKFAVILQPEEQDNYEHVWLDEDGNSIKAGGTAPFNPVIPYKDGKCIYLGSDNRCTIYERRPTLCREFSCLSGYRKHGDKGHGFFLEDHPEVVELIELTIRNTRTT